MDCFTAAGFGYLLPGSPWGHRGGSRIFRFSLANITDMKVVDLAIRDSTFRGFFGGFTDGIFGYLVPYDNDGWVNNGYFIRFELERFHSDYVSWRRLTDIDPALGGFKGGFTDGTFGYLLPSRRHKLVRIRL